MKHILTTSAVLAAAAMSLTACAGTPAPAPSTVAEVSKVTATPTESASESDSPTHDSSAPASDSVVNPDAAVDLRKDIDKYAPNSTATDAEAEAFALDACSAFKSIPTYDTVQSIIGQAKLIFGKDSDAGYIAGSAMKTYCNDQIPVIKKVLGEHFKTSDAGPSDSATESSDDGSSESSRT